MTTRPRPPAESLANELLSALRTSWSWALPSPQLVLATNDFGNLAVQCADGAIWRICPEELAATKIADDAAALDALWKDPEFRTDWDMAHLVTTAELELGALPAARCYCLKIPAVLGGEYEADNMGTIPIQELIAFSGDVARQVKDLPDGVEIKFQIDPTA